MAKNYERWDELTEDYLNKAEKAMETAVTALEADTKLNTHVLSGALRRSWTHDVKRKDGDIIGSVGSNLQYAVYEDDYHPNLSKALDENLDKYLKMIENGIKE